MIIASTPQESAKCLLVLLFGVTAIILVLGLNFESALAVEPLFVDATIAAASKSLATTQADLLIEFVVVFSKRLTLVFNISS